MATLKKIAMRAAGLASMAGGAVIAAHLAPVLVAVVAVVGVLAALVILTAIFGGKNTRGAAQEVLRILFDRKRQ
jgi:hypothetical protein